jgi:hypothetical protein
VTIVTLVTLVTVLERAAVPLAPWNLVDIGLISRQFIIDRAAQPCTGASMSSWFNSLTSSPFERRVPPGRLEPIFRQVFRSYGAAARYFKVAEMTIWRWCHDRSPPPEWVLDALAPLIQKKVESSHFAQDELKRFVALSGRPPRPLSGCTARYARREKRPW